MSIWQWLKFGGDLREVQAWVSQNLFAACFVIVHGNITKGFI